MRANSVVMLCFAVTAITACGGNDVTDVSRPPLAGVRLINGLTEGSAVDIHAVDQIELSPVANNLSYRNATIYFPTEAGDRRIRVFPTSTDASVTSVAMLNVTITFQADTRVTLLLTGSTVAGTVRFVVIPDDITPPAAGTIRVRAVNASSGAIDAYLVDAASDPLPPAPTGANVAAQGASAYVARTAGAAEMRVTPAGSATVSASATGPTAPATPAGSPSLPGAGVNTAGTSFSVYYFQAVAAIAASQGRPAVAATAASAIWLVDRNPAD
jgi:uncharacterized protein DUF4397